MGTCQSTSKDTVVTTTKSNEKQQQELHKVTKKQQQQPDTKKDGSPTLKNGSDDSCTSSTLPTPSTSLVTPLTPPTTTLQQPLSQHCHVKRFKPGYSSGGSSSSCEDSPNEDTSQLDKNKNNDTQEIKKPHVKKSSSASLDEILCDWKNQLCADGDLKTAVVRIETDFGRPIEEHYEGVHDGPILGTGVSGTVRLVKHKKTGVEYAAKSLDLGMIKDQEKGIQSLREEIFTMCQLDHPNIVRLEEVYESNSEIYLIQELCTGGDLFDRLETQSDYHYSEAQCAKLVKQILSAIRYLHSKNIIHRDLKLENFIFASNSPDSDLKMIDFGLSKHFASVDELQHESVGTPYSVAPEVIRGSYNVQCDIWSIGVITFLLLCGDPPYGGCDGENLVCVRDNILRGQVVFRPEYVWDHVSNEGKQFVKRLLNSDPKLRPTAREAQRDPWIQIYSKMASQSGLTNPDGNCNDNFNDSKDGCVLSTTVMESLVHFKEYSDMRKLLYEVLSFTLLPDQIKDLRTEFEKVDRDGDGEITLQELRQVLVQNAENGTLGSLTEQEVQDIFNALRVRKSEPTICWHEFIAAGLSQCHYDERNLRLTFDRLDTDRKGYIAFDDMMQLLGTEEERESLYQVWSEGCSECMSQSGKITYQGFVKLIKGQTPIKEPLTPNKIIATNSPVSSPTTTRKRISLRSSHHQSPTLDSVPEGSVSPTSSKVRRSGMLCPNSALLMPPLGDTNPDISFPRDDALKLPVMPFSPQQEHSPPPHHHHHHYNHQGHHCRQERRSKSMVENGSTPLVIFYDSEEDNNEDSAAIHVNCPHETKRTTTTTPVATPSRLHNMTASNHGSSNNNGAVKSPMLANTALYKKHNMRLSLFEAFKRFDDSKLKHQHQQQASPGLIMRRGSAVISPNNITAAAAAAATKEVEEEKQGEQKLQSQHDFATRQKIDTAMAKSGRPRRNRQKTTSDMSGMMKL